MKGSSSNDTLGTFSEGKKPTPCLCNRLENKAIAGYSEHNNSLCRMYFAHYCQLYLNLLTDCFAFKYILIAVCIAACENLISVTNYFPIQCVR